MFKRPWVLNQDTTVYVRRIFLVDFNLAVVIIIDHQTTKFFGYNYGIKIGSNLIVNAWHLLL